MSAIKCPNPACGGTEGYAVRPVYEWHRGFRWWRFWQGVKLYREQVGDCVVCCRCDAPLVLTDSDAYLTQKGMEKLGVPRFRVAGQREPVENGRGDRMHPVGIEP